jgi:hypothetical protein
MAAVAAGCVVEWEKSEVKKLKKKDGEKVNKAEGEEIDVKQLNQAKGKKSDAKQLERNMGEGTKDEDEHEHNGEDDDGRMMKDVAMFELNAMDETGTQQLTTISYFGIETWTVADGLEDEHGLQNRSVSTRKNKKKHTEIYEGVGTIQDGELEWICEDETTYFRRDGLSMVHGVRFHDRIRQRELAELKELNDMLIAERNEKKAAKQERQKAVSGRTPSQGEFSC